VAHQVAVVGHARAKGRELKREEKSIEGTSKESTISPSLNDKWTLKTREGFTI